MAKKRLAMFVGVIATLVMAFGGTASARNDNDNGWTVTVTHNPVDWELTSEVCLNLPDGIELTGGGQGATTRKGGPIARGNTHLHETSIKQISVTDNENPPNTYRFDYLNTAWSISRDGTNFTGIMFDVFLVKAEDREPLRNGFLAENTIGADVLQGGPDQRVR